MIDRLAQIRGSLTEIWEESKKKPKEPEEIRQHLQELPPDRLVENLRGVQSTQLKASGWGIGGLLISASSLIAVDFINHIVGFSNLDNFRDPVILGSELMLFGGGITSILGARTAGNCSYVLREYIYPEIQRRLIVSTEPPTQETNSVS
ncbi:MAG: hypothetical protein Q7R49_04205 [Candidatus Daviesbacteria bacterium]|nr:hypothetical protein [Candidatus Daviesbacteria bacterium]